MKKLLSVVLSGCMLVSLCACGGGTKKAFEESKVAYDNVNKAYEITEQMGSDIYEAWRLGIYDDDDILSDGAKHLATELNLSEDEILDGAAYVLASVEDKKWEEMTEDEKKESRDMAELSFGFFEDDLFSYCVMITSGAYVVNGKVAEVEAALDTAKSQMKELSENFSDYEHYPNLKGYYTTTQSFFDFCQNPTGSFEQVKNTINDYKNEARDFKSDLDYIFEE